jgi:hypothetical protein
LTNRFGLRLRVGITGFAAAAAAAAFAAAASSMPALGDTTGCPSTSGKQTSSLVGASFSGTTTVTYVFDSFVDQSPVGGVPGLIRYCVYPGTSPEGGVVVSAAGDDGSAWKDNPPPQFSFDRPDGNPSNIGLDGRLNYLMGTATWTGAAPTDQTILLHINDPAECANLYPAGDPDAGTAGTCWVFPGTQTKTASPLTASKNATPSFSRSFAWTIDKTVDQSHQNIPAGGSATFNYTVIVTKLAGTDGSWQVSGTIDVANPNAPGDDVSGVNVGDAINDPNASCNVTGGSNAIPGAGSSAFLYSCTYSAAPASLSQTNTATVSWPSQTLADGSTLTGNSTTATALIDWSSVTPKLIDDCTNVADSNPDATVVGSVCATTTFNYSETHPGVGGTCTDYNNTASLTTLDTATPGSSSQTATVCVGEDLSVSKTATPTFTRTFKWGIDKKVDHSQLDIAAGGSATFNYLVNVTHDGGTDSDWQVSGVITVSNPNDWEAITLANVADLIDKGGSCSITSGDVSGTIGPKGFATFDYLCTYGSAPSPTDFTNTATATWDAGAASTASGSASGSKTGTFGAPTTIVDGSVNVTDTLGGPLGTVLSTDPSPTPFIYSNTVAGTPGTCVTIDNTATFTTNTTDTTGSDGATAKVCVGLDLTVSKTATSSFTRTYNWKIAKSVDKTILDAGGTATYTVTVTETGFTDSAWQVTGAITVNNPNDWEAITANITDAVDNGGSCSVTGGTSVSIPAGGSATVPYSCTWLSAPNSASGTNKATATWDSGTFFTPSASASGTAGFAFSTPTTTVNKTINVSDSFGGSLGSAMATDGTLATPFTVKSFIYTRTFTPPTSGCQLVTNTATIVETGQSASATVKVCNTGALTMGFWQNKNGQGLISGGLSTAGICNSGTWLRQLAPFQDLSSTANCTAVASYVYNTIKAATCGGATCNAMLKAQMLATALDVYFSDPSLGGNKIGAPAPIGGVAIDLTKICAMIDGSGGSTCSGTYENVSSAFGGATSLTVLQMLSYSAGQSNVGGSAWYTNAKTIQVLAKDAFDAINNQVAVSP